MVITECKENKSSREEIRRMKAFKGFNKDLTCRGFFSMRRVRSSIQRKLSVVRRGSMRVSILWIVLVITVRLRAFFMR